MNEYILDLGVRIDSKIEMEATHRFTDELSKKYKSPSSGFGFGIRDAQFEVNTSEDKLPEVIKEAQEIADKHGLKLDYITCDLKSKKYGN